jgi:hypothetical protein
MAESDVASLAEATSRSLDAARSALLRMPIDSLGGEDRHAFTRALSSLKLLESLTDELLQGVRLQHLRLADVDARQLAVALAPEDDDLAPDLATAAALADRLAESLLEHITATSRAPTGDSRGGDRLQMGDVGNARGVRAMADAYGRDAHLERRVMVVLFVTAITLLVAAAAITLVGFAVADDKRELRVDQFAAFAGVSAVLTFASITTAWQSVRHRTMSREACRLDHQIRGFDSFVSTMGRPAQDLIRGTMVQRLFPRLVEDDDPLREPRWPDAGRLLEAVTHREQPAQAESSRE